MRHVLALRRWRRRLRKRERERQRRNRPTASGLDKVSLAPFQVFARPSWRQVGASLCTLGARLWDGRVYTPFSFFPQAAGLVFQAKKTLGPGGSFSLLEQKADITKTDYPQSVISVSTANSGDIGGWAQPRKPSSPFRKTEANQDDAWLPSMDPFATRGCRKTKSVENEERERKVPPPVKAPLKGTPRRRSSNSGGRHCPRRFRCSGHTHGHFLPLLQAQVPRPI